MPEESNRLIEENSPNSVALIEKKNKNPKFLARPLVLYNKLIKDNFVVHARHRPN
jgi:hypothetical protein